MIVVPPDLVDSQQMPFVSFLVLSRVSQGAFMDFTFLSSDQKRKGVKLIEVKAETTGQTDEGSLFFFLSSQFKSEYFFWLKLVLHQTPVHDSTIRGDGVEVELFGDVRVPSDLPDRVSMLLGSYGGFVDGFVMLVSDIVHQNGTVIESSCQ